MAAPRHLRGLNAQRESVTSRMDTARPVFPPLHVTDLLEREGSEQWTHLYAAPQPILHLARAQDSPHVQVFHLQAMQLISNNHRVL